MYVAISRFEAVSGTGDELTQVARQLAARLSRLPGFVSFLMVEAGADIVTTITIFEDEASLKESEGLTSASLAHRLDSLPVRPIQSTIGRLTFQKGL